MQFEIFYNFPNLICLKLTCFVFKTDDGDLKSLKQLYCPQLKSLSVSLLSLSCLQTHLVWYLELFEKFSNSLQYLKIGTFYSTEDLYRNWKKNRLKIEKKALEVGSTLKNLKDVDIAFTEADALSVWTNLFHGIRTGLEKLALDFKRDEKLFRESDLLKKHYFPNLKSLRL